MNSLFISISSFFYIVLLMMVYFSKKRLISIENKIYRYLIVISFYGALFEILCFPASQNYNAYPIFSTIILKVYLLYIVAWMLLFTFYVLLISNENYEKNNEQSHTFFKKLLIISIVVFVLLYGLVIILPINLYYDGTIAYTYGPSVDLIFILSGTCVVLWLFSFLINFRKINKKKYIPALILIVIGTAAVLIQKYNPNLILTCFVQSFVTFLMYFTIENPDLKMLNEMTLAKEQAVKANNAKTDFLSSMSHEIRTPLNAIIVTSQDIEQSSNLSATEKDQIKDIKSASDTLLDIINNILDMNQIESGSLSINNANYDSNELLTSVTKLIKHKIKDKGLDFKVHIEPDIPKELYGDRVNVKKVIINLLSNAVKYTDNGIVEYNVQCVNSNGVCRLLITVSDTGRGIKKEHIDKLFTKFERLDEKNTTIEGTGLGLAITKNLLNAMGGNITVNSEVGVGSRFVVTLDQKIVNMEPIGIDTKYIENNPKIETDIPVNEEKIERIDLTNKRILIVDDNRLNLKVETNMLKKNYNATIDAIESGQECIDKIKANEKYDLILMDDMMPGMNGIETFQKLKLLNNFNIPTVMLTANALEGEKEKYIAEGFDYYLAKPVRLEDMNTAIEYFFKDESKFKENKTEEKLRDTIQFPPLPKELYQIDNDSSNNTSC